VVIKLDDFGHQTPLHDAIKFAAEITRWKKGHACSSLV
jgi:hypothetical protein